MATEVIEDLLREIYNESSPEPDEHDGNDLPDYINTLTDECLLRLFSFLDKIDLTQCNMVCKRWNVITKDKSLWRIVNFCPLQFNVDDHSFMSLTVSKMKYTQKIYLGSLRVTFKMLKNLAQNNKHLNTLIFGRGSTMEEVPSGRQKVAFPKYLQTLDLRLALGKFEFLNDLQRNFAYLKSLGVSSNCFDEDRLQVFFSRLPALQTVDLTNCLQIDDLGVELLANNCPCIKSLCLIGCRYVYGSTFDVLLAKCSNLRTLLLRYLKIEDDVISQNTWSSSNIEELDISACPRLTWQGLFRLLVQLKNLVYLNMSYCGEGNAVNDTVLTEMSSLGNLQQLRMLDIRWSFYITSDVLDAFLSKCLSLEYLGIYQSFHIFSEHLAEVIPKLPYLKILEFGASYPQELSLSNIIPQLILTTRGLEVLSLINFTAVQTNLVFKYLKTLIKKCSKLKRINFCDCSADLVRVGKQATEKYKHIEVTVKWECALPPPNDTLDAIVSLTS